jgi:hypothetical protein
MFNNEHHMPIRNKRKKLEQSWSLTPGLFTSGHRKYEGKEA